MLCYIGIYLYVTYDGEGMPVDPYLALTVFALPISGLYSLLLVDLRMSRRPKFFFVVSVGKGALLVGMNLLLIVGMKTGALGKCLAPFVTNLLVFIYCLYYYRRNLRQPFDRALFRQMVKFCFPLTLAAMLLFFSNGYDRVLLERLCGDTNELGYYVVGFSIAQYINVFQTSLSSTFQPDIYESITRNDWRKFFKVAAVLILSTIGICAVFILAAPLVVDILTAGRYMPSVPYTRIISLSLIFSMMYNTIADVTIAKGYTRLPLVNNILSSLLSMAAFWWLITGYEYVGAAWGLVAAFAIKFFCNVVLLLIFRRLRRRSMRCGASRDS